MGQGMYGGIEGNTTPVTVPVQTPVQGPTPTPSHVGRGAPPAQFRGRAMAQGLRGRGGFVGRGRGRYDGRTSFPRARLASLTSFNPFQHHKDLLDLHPRCRPVSPPDLGIKIDTRTEMGMRLRLRVWITVVLPRIVRGRRRGNQKIVDIAGEVFTCQRETSILTRGSGSVAFHQAWMTVADLKGAELFYYVYDFFIVQHPGKHHLPTIATGCESRGAMVIVGVCIGSYFLLNKLCFHSFLTRCCPMRRLVGLWFHILILFVSHFPTFDRALYIFRLCPTTKIKVQVANSTSLDLNRAGGNQDLRGT